MKRSQAMHYRQAIGVGRPAGDDWTSARLMESAHGSHWGAPNVQRQWTPRRTASTATDIRRGFYRVFAPSGEIVEVILI